MTQQIFPLVECVHGPNCICPADERALRHFSAGTWPHGPMTTPQREWAIREADWAGEGQFSEEELRKMDDQWLAKSVLQAWADYARSQGLM